MSRLFHVGFPFSVLDGDCFSSSSTWSLAFLRADTQVGGVTRRIAHFGDSAGNCPGFSSMASMGLVGLSRSQRFVFGDHAPDATQ
jgi:hypothetical protein